MLTPDELIKELNDLTASKRLAQICSADRLSGKHVQINGKAYIDFTVRDCLDLVSHPLVIKQAVNYLQKCGVGGYSSRTLTGTSKEHRHTEARICEITGYKSALLFSSKNQAIWTLICCLLDERDVLLLENDGLTPLSDAAHLVNCECVTFKTEDPNSLRLALDKISKKRRKLVVLESASPLSAKALAINQIWPLIIASGADLILDESYSFGVLGTRGAGLFDHCNIIERPLGSIIDFSSILGFNLTTIAAAPELISLLVARSQSLASELAPPTMLCVALSRALDLAELALLEREKLKKSVDIFLSGLKQQGWQLSDVDIPIVCLPFQDFQAANKFKVALAERGYICEIISARTNRKEVAYLKFIITLHHSTLDIQNLLQDISIIKSNS